MIMTSWRMCFSWLLYLTRLCCNKNCRSPKFEGCFSLVRESESESQEKLSRKSTYDPVKTKNWSCKQSWAQWNGSRKNQNISIFFWLCCLWLCHLQSTENQIVGIGSRSGRINQYNACLPLCNNIGSALLLLLLTLTMQFSLDRKQQSCNRNQNAVFTRS